MDSWVAPEAAGLGVTPQKPSTVDKDLGGGAWTAPETQVVQKAKISGAPAPAPDQSFGANFAEGAKEKVKDLVRGVMMHMQSLASVGGGKFLSDPMTGETQVSSAAPDLTSQITGGTTASGLPTDQAAMASAGADLTQTQAAQATANQKNAGLRNTWGGILGGMAPSAIAAAGAPSSILGQAAMGAAVGSADPNEGAALGGASSALGAGVGKVIGKLAPTITNNARMQQLVEYLKSKGITPDLAQQLGSKWAQTVKNITVDSPFTSGGAAKENTAKFTKAVMSRVGSPSAEDASPEELGSAMTRIGNQFDTVTANTDALMTRDHLNGLAGVMKDAENNLADPNAIATIRKRITDILNVAKRQSVDIGEREPGAPIVTPSPDIVQGGPPATLGTAVGPASSGGIGQSLPFGENPTVGAPPSGDDTPFITGKQFSNIKKWMDKWVLGPNPDLKDYGGQIQQVLNDALRDSSDPKYIDLLDKTNRQYRVLLQTAKSVGPDGQVQPSAFSRTVATAKNWRQAKTNVTGDQDTAELARAGGAVLKDTPNSGTARRYILQRLAASGAGAGLGAGIGGYEGGEKGALHGAAIGAAGGAGIGVLAHAATYNPTVINMITKMAISPAKKAQLIQSLTKGGGIAGASLGSTLGGDGSSASTAP